MKYNTNNYKAILKALDLPSYWEGRLKSKVTKESKHSLRMLNDLGDILPGSAISHKLFSGNQSVRKHAKSVFMNLSSHDSFRFLDNDFDRDFNALDEVRIHKALVSKSSEKPLPLLMRWVNVATNDEYKAYLIKEIAFFNQIESAPQLVALYKESSNVVVKNSIVSTLGKIGYKDAVPTLIADYDYANISTQELILQTLSKLGGGEVLEFLINLYAKAANKEQMVKLIEYIYKIDNGGMKYNKLKQTVKSDFERTAIAFVERSEF